MTRLLTQRALRVFAVLENYRAGSPDILDALLPFFEPILAECSGNTFDPESFAERLRSAYKWNFTADIAEELIPRFQKKKWVEQVSGTRQDAVYRVNYSNPAATNVGSNEVQISETLNALVDQFHKFIDQISPLSAFVRTKDELSDILVEWLISIDAY